MKLRTLGLVLGTCAACAIASRAAAQATITTLDSTGDVGQSSDVAYGPNGLAMVSYGDNTNQSLKVAACQDVACTSAMLHTLDPAGTGVASTSIAFPPDGRALVSYRALSSNTVKVARCADAGCSSATIAPVEQLTALGAGTAIAVGADGRALVVYSDGTADIVKVAHCNDADCTTSTITPYPGHGFQNPTVTIAGDGLPLFAADDGVSRPVGHCSNASCASATFTSLVGIPFPPSASVKYFDASLSTGTDGRGLLAMTLEMGSIIGASTVVRLQRCQDVTCTGLGPAGHILDESIHPALAIPPDGRPLVASYGGLPPPARLQVTRCQEINCGSPNAPPPTYPIEAPGIGHDPRVAIGPAGIGLVSYFDDANQDLKVAYLEGGAELDIGDAEVVEGNSGLTAARFEVRLSGAVGASGATVAYATQGGSATSGVDFLAAAGSLTFTPGTLTQFVSVGVVGDLAVESLETFVVNLSSPQNAFIADGQGLGRIVDDDVAGSPAAPGVLDHGASVVADLGTSPGADVYRIGQAPYASYEVVADGTAGDVNPLDLARVASDGVTVIQTGAPVGTGTSRSLAWQAASQPVLGEVVRVSGSCGPCAPGSLYRLRAYETTLRGARFNNAGSQTTVLLLQNPGPSPVAASIRFWSPSGELLATHAVPALGPKAVLALLTPTVPGVAGQSGSITVSHDGPYAGLTGKAVALEPATGFSFDTPLLPRPR